MDFIILIIGFFLLIKGADIFVDGASSIAKKIGIPSVIVGLTIVSLGTSAPELAVSLISSFNGNNGIAVGNVLGSNLFNTLVVLGGTAIVAPLLIKKSTIKRDYIATLVVTILTCFLIFGLVPKSENMLSRISGIILLVVCVVYMFILVKAAKKDSVKDEENTSEIKMSKNILLSLIGVVGIVFGGNLVVDSATNIAYALGMSEKLVGLTIVAVGTSLPELVTSIVAALKGENDIALGNVLGSNIFNLVLILGASATITPIAVSGVMIIDFIILIAVTLFIGALIFFNKKDEKRLGRLEGIILVGIYVAYLAYIIMRN
ncbi:MULTISPECIES: calcium/sodium antiporter [Clostridium]|uniref:calcium/sodium antiporter n=1 Tax=Clostridium TaxID=1485 RepID=UPI000DD04E9F|nr:MULTISPECIES: calcium/sodium antiporter [Clostridium]MBS7130144.1 calcium/sodium antiporter [Clostridium sp.]MDB2093173.1 calcium/sodium antiporter [Clostridium paraputrificum]MDB2097958.1 calcium/sodium antiporter [Clostridium paraputrificum]MDB2117972.1 calcium/sodium antiporter [Clostridium paraputrificum]MDB2119872.1 calcium/sodium antiporter [Clostridium paraputrificum]